jgi:hypothetical protein
VKNRAGDYRNLGTLGYVKGTEVSAYVSPSCRETTESFQEVSLDLVFHPNPVWTLYLRTAMDIESGGKGRAFWKSGGQRLKLYKVTQKQVTVPLSLGLLLCPLVDVPNLGTRYYSSVLQASTSTLPAQLTFLSH